MRRVTIFGPPSSGKTTQIAKVKNILTQEGRRCLEIPDYGRIAKEQKNLDILDIRVQLYISNLYKKSEEVIKKSDSEWEYLLIDGGAVTNAVYLYLRANNSSFAKGLLTIKNSLDITKIILGSSGGSPDAFSGAFIYLPKRKELVNDGVRDQDISNINEVSNAMETIKNYLISEKEGKREVYTIDSNREIEGVTSEIISCINYHFFNHTPSKENVCPE